MQIYTGGSRVLGDSNLDVGMQIDVVDLPEASGMAMGDLDEQEAVFQGGTNTDINGEGVGQQHLRIIDGSIFRYHSKFHYLIIFFKMVVPARLGLGGPYYGKDKIHIKGRGCFDNY